MNKVFDAYFGNGVTKGVVLTPGLTFDTAPKLIPNISKLDAKLEKEKTSTHNEGKDVIGIIDFGSGQVTLFDGGKYKGIIWSSRSRLSGTWREW